MVKILKTAWEDNPLLDNGFCVIDVEIMNDIKDSTGRWNYGESIISVTGMAYDDQIVQVIREFNDTEEDYASAVWEEIHPFLAEGYQLASFNWGMEHGALNKLLNPINQKISYITEIKPYMGKGCSLDKFYTELLPKGAPRIPDPLFNKTDECAKLWNTNDPSSQELVIKHNIADLKKEAYVLANQKILREGKKINEKGWLTE